MQLTTSIKLDLHFTEAAEQVKKAAESALKDVIISAAKDAIENSPYRTGHNRRSIMYEVGSKPGQRVDNSNDAVPFTDTAPEKLDDLEGALYSTSGYGGVLEVGGVNRPARPYIAPAVTERFTPGEMTARIQEKLGE